MSSEDRTVGIPELDAALDDVLVVGLDAGRQLADACPQQIDPDAGLIGCEAETRHLLGAAAGQGH
jgi:hypothetical protein